MTATDERQGFGLELPEWSLRVCVSALPSAAMAVFAGYHSSAASLGMLLGVGLWTLVAALAFSDAGLRKSQRGASWTNAFVHALWIKVVWTVPGALVATCAGQYLPGSCSRLFIPLMVPAGIELWTGIVAVRCVERVWSQAGEPVTGMSASFGGTLLATLIQGAAVVVAIAIVAAAIGGVRALFSPGRRRADEVSN